MEEMVNLTKRTKFGKIGNCHGNKEVLFMFYSEQQAIDACVDEPSLIFNLIKRGEFELVQKLLDNNLVNINTCDGVGNDVMTRLVKAKQYDLVMHLMKKKNWDVNHQNIEGNTFAHVLVLDSSVSALNVVEQLVKKKNFVPNIKNEKGETVFDKAINNNYIYTAFKILDDKRFDDIDLVTFKKLCNVCVRNTYYGKYSRLNNLEVIVEKLERKDLEPNIKKIVDEISNNMEVIKYEMMKDRTKVLESIINSSIIESV